MIASEVLVTSLLEYIMFISKKQREDAVKRLERVSRGMVAGIGFYGTLEEARAQVELEENSWACEAAIMWPCMLRIAEHVWVIGCIV